MGRPDPALKLMVQWNFECKKMGLRLNNFQNGPIAIYKRGKLIFKE